MQLTDGFDEGLGIRLCGEVLPKNYSCEHAALHECGALWGRQQRKRTTSGFIICIITAVRRTR